MMRVNVRNHRGCVMRICGRAFTGGRVRLRSLALPPLVHLIVEDTDDPL